jgi:hypothetical protein
MSHYGIVDRELAFFSSYLSGRKQVVCVSGSLSKEMPIEFGVPQGSVLGPILFILMINDLQTNVGANSILYADDTTFINTDRCYQNLQRNVKNTQSEASNWFRANGFVLNENKTQHILFSLKNTLEHGTPVKFLGIYVDGRLTWETHIMYVARKLSRVIYLLKTLKNHVPDNFVRSAYFAFFHSVLSYGLKLWGNSCHIDRILVLQKEAIRTLVDAGSREHCKPLFIKLGVLTVINQYIFLILMSIKKVLPALTCRGNMHTYDTRGRNLIDVPRCRLEKTRSAHVVCGMNLFNLLPQPVATLPIKLFKSKLHDWLVARPFYSLAEFREAMTTDPLSV